MKNTIIKLLCCMGLGILLSLLCIKGINVFSDMKLDMVNIYVAREDIRPRTKISMKNLAVLKVPSGYISEHVYTNKDDILGKYTDIQGKIPRGSLFYKSMLYNEEDLPDYPVTQLKEGQISYSMPCDLLQLSGNTIVEGQRVDLYGTLIIDQQPVVDCLVQNVRVIGIKDNRGLNLTDEDSNGIPSLILMALDKASLEYVSKLIELGSVQLYATTLSYDDNEAVLNKRSKLIEYLL